MLAPQATLAVYYSSGNVIFEVEVYAIRRDILIDTKVERLTEQETVSSEGKKEQSYQRVIYL